MKLPISYDVLIIGGSVAGLSAALALGRSLRSVLIIDSDRPCNRQTPHSQNFFSRDGIAPAELAAIARQQVLAYPTVTWLDGKAVALTKNNRNPTGGGAEPLTFTITTDQNERFEGRKVLLATGVEDLMPPIEGFAESWGRSVLHCPYCHGYEVHNQPLGVLMNGEQTLERVGMIHNLSQTLTLFTDGPANFPDADRATLRRLNVPVVETPIVRIEHTDGFLQALHLQDGNRLSLTALFAHVPFRQHTDLGEQVGGTMTPAGHVAVVNLMGNTNVPGLFAAGDTTTFMRSVANATAAGSLAGAAINRELVLEGLAAL